MQNQYLNQYPMNQQYNYNQQYQMQKQQYNQMQPFQKNFRGNQDPNDYLNKKLEIQQKDMNSNELYKDMCAK